MVKEVVAWRSKDGSVHNTYINACIADVAHDITALTKERAADGRLSNADVLELMFTDSGLSAINKELLSQLIKSLKQLHGV